MRYLVAVEEEWKVRRVVDKRKCVGGKNDEWAWIGWI